MKEEGPKLEGPSSFGSILNCEFRILNYKATTFFPRETREAFDSATDGAAF
jgi:hypothetical protein